MRLSMILHGPRLGPTIVRFSKGGGEMKGVNVPAKIRQFLVNSLQRHRDGVFVLGGCCGRRGRGRGV